MNSEKPKASDGMERKGKHSGSDHMTQTSTIMAILRFRRKRVLLMILFAFLFWLMYLLSALPSKSKSDGAGDALEKFIARKQLTPKPVPQTNNNVEPVKNVIDAPQLPPVEKDPVENKDPSNIENKNGENEKSNATKEHLDIRALGILIKNKTYEMGIKLKNKTVEVGEKVKNKTLEHLAVIGVVAPKPLPQQVFVPKKWNLTVSFEDIGDIMKETQFLNKVDPLNLDGPILLSSRNRTTNFTYTMPLKFGFCDCFERYCVCCSQLTNKRLHLNSKACSNFTFISKTHELDVQFSLDLNAVHRNIISADKSPLLCLGSTPKVADICVHFFNMTFRVNEHNSHQTQLLGCMDLSLNLYNRTIGAFPVDCFQIPGDPNQVHKERHFNMFNWVP